MSFLDQIGIGLLTTGIWAGIGLIGTYFLRNRLISYFKLKASEYLAETIEFFTKNPQILQPLIQNAIQSTLKNPNGVMPKEAKVNLPILGKVPASWLEPVVKMGLGQLMKKMPQIGQAAEEASSFG